MLNKRNIGSEFENIASEYLKSKSVVILDKNFRSSKGEVDIIGLDGDTLVFFEVKQSRSASAPYAIITVLSIRNIFYLECVLM